MVIKEKKNMNTVYYGIKTNNYEEETLIKLMKTGFELLVIPWNEFKGHTNDMILLNSIVLLSSERDDFWKNVTFQMRQKRCKYYTFMVPVEFYESDNAQFQFQLVEFVNRLPSGAHLSLIVPLTGDLTHWEFWNNIKTPNVSVMLYLSAEVDSNIISRWRTEPVTSIMISGANFLHNYSLPVLPNHLQEILKTFIVKNPPTIILSTDECPLQYLKCLKWLITKVKIDPTSDILIDPLQPLADNLSLKIYEIFEKDIIKYDQYEKAIFMALKNIATPCVKVLVIGPGRGALINRLVKVIKNFNHEFIIDSVEKNPKCYAILREKNENQWNNKINLANEDIRDWKNTNYNLIISELLGSFGCNELCPEILQRFTNLDTIMIPQSYENHLQPIYSPLVSNLANEQLERPYLIKLNSFYTMSSLKTGWKFTHPTRVNTSRLRSMNFHIPHKGKVNGFQGFFVANLYGTIQIGIHPQLTDGFCISWYPLLFPILEINCDSNSTLSFQIERLCGNKVWYEWTINNNVYNKSGLYYAMGLK